MQSSAGCCCRNNNLRSGWATLRGTLGIVSEHDHVRVRKLSVTMASTIRDCIERSYSCPPPTPPPPSPVPLCPPYSHSHSTSKKPISDCFALLQSQQAILCAHHSLKDGSLAQCTLYFRLALSHIPAVMSRQVRRATWEEAEANSTPDGTLFHFSLVPSGMPGRARPSGTAPVRCLRRAVHQTAQSIRQKKGKRKKKVADKHVNKREFVQ